MTQMYNEHNTLCRQIHTVFAGWFYFIISKLQPNIISENGADSQHKIGLTQPSYQHCTAHWAGKCGALDELHNASIKSYFDTSTG